MKLFGYSDHQGEFEEDVPDELYIPKHPDESAAAIHHFLFKKEQSEVPLIVDSTMWPCGTLFIEDGFDELNSDENTFYCVGPDPVAAKAKLKECVNEMWPDALK